MHKIWTVSFLVFYVSLCSCSPCEVVKIPSIFLKAGVPNIILLTDEYCQICRQLIEDFGNAYESFKDEGLVTNFIIANRGSSDFLMDVYEEFSFNNNTLWDILDGERGDVYIIDKCGRLAYGIVHPYNNLKYITASILSTFFDNPCGDCDKERRKPTKRPPPPLFPELSVTQSTNEVIKPNEDGTIPFNLIYNLPHFHKDDPKEYRVIELRSGDPLYHGHLADSPGSSAIKKIFHVQDASPVSAHEEEENEIGTDSEERTDLKQHYQKILRWLNCYDTFFGSN